MRHAIVVGSGAYLPEKIIPNSEMETMVETTDAWIRERSGIEQRHVVEGKECTSDLAVKAAALALQSYEGPHPPTHVDALIVATSTPDHTMPSTATIVQRKLGLDVTFAFDIAAACSGFVYGLQLVHSLISSSQVNSVLLIGAESMSKIIDWNDRSTCVLFGDGAGALLFGSKESAKTDRGILAAKLHSDGQYNNLLYTSGGVSGNQIAGTLLMQGKEVFRHGVEKMTEVTNEVLYELGLYPQDVDWIVPHQANKRMVDAIAKKLQLAPEKFIVTLAKHANTSAASIPLALNEAVKDGRIKKGDLVAMPALGAGLTWGCCVIKW